MTDRAMSPAERAARQMLADKKDLAATQKAYERSLTNTPPAPATPASAPVEKKAKGGYVAAADGCAQRGKTKGRMV